MAKLAQEPWLTWSAEEVHLKDAQLTAIRVPKVEMLIEEEESVIAECSDYYD